MVIIETKGRTFADRAANSVKCCCREDHAVKGETKLTGCGEIIGHPGRSGFSGHVGTRWQREEIKMTVIDNSFRFFSFFRKSLT